MQPRTIAVLLLSALLVLSAFLLDIIMLSGDISWIAYVILISVSFWFPWRYAPVLLALIGTILTIATHFHSPGEGSFELVLVNRGLEISVLWVTALLVMGYRLSAQSLKDRESRLRALIDTAVDGVIIIDAMGTVQDYNPACEKLFGYPAREIIGQNVKMLMPPPYQQEHDRYLASYRETGQRRIIGIGREVEGRRRDGSTFPMELSVGEAHQGDQQIFVGVIRDITARKAAESALKAAKEQAEAANQAKSLFLANMSHEIRTPMNAVLGYTQIIENDPDLPEDHRQPLKAIRNAGDHLMELINDILDLSKIEAGAMELDIKDFDLGSLVDLISEIFEIRCKQKGLDWRVESRIDARAVRGDEGKLRQILINFLSNAVKFTDTGEIALRITQAANRYRFEVTDTGPGITPDAKERIFEPFQQAEEGIIKGGTGLGLAISKRYIDLMGGELGVQSQPGKESCFSFSVKLPPAYGPITQGLLDHRSITRLAPGYRVRALVVDDVEDNREVLSRMLQAAGVEVIAAINGREAFACEIRTRGAYSRCFQCQ